MHPAIIIILLSATSLLSFVFGISPYVNYLPQLLAAITIIFVLFTKQRQSSLINLLLVSLVVNLIVFATNGLSSPLFFLYYFLLFTIAFQNSPVITLSYSLFTILLLAQSLNSLSSILPLLSLLLITPLSWLIGRQSQENNQLHNSLATDETKVLLWSSLKLKTGITKIIDNTSILLSQPQFTPTQIELLKSIKDSAKYLLTSSQKLTKEIDEETDE